jgi:hypothetical protein
MNHLDEDAELYALALTEPECGAEIESHVAECAPCRVRVVAAEDAAAALAGTLPAMPRAAARPGWMSGLAVAAAIALAATAGYEGYTAHAAGSQLATTNVALNVIAASSFGHTTLMSQPGVIAKAMYARDGSWCYVVVNGAPRGTHVLLRHGTQTIDEGALDAGTPSTLFIQHPGKSEGITLVANAATIAQGTPIY